MQVELKKYDGTGVDYPNVEKVKITISGFVVYQYPPKHALDFIKGEDEGKKGQARADKEGDELPES